MKGGAKRNQQPHFQKKQTKKKHILKMKVTLEKNTKTWVSWPEHTQHAED